MRVAIGLAVFGDPRYARYLGTAIRAYRTLFPGYELWVHTDDPGATGYGATLRQLSARGVVKLTIMPARRFQGKCERMLWRLSSVWADRGVDAVFSRDLDALPSWRERRATDAFLRDGDHPWIHTILDHAQHVGIMGGLCGFRAGVLRAWADDFEQFVFKSGFTDSQWDTHGADQFYLNRIASAHCDKVLEQSILARPTIMGAKFLTALPVLDDPSVPTRAIAQGDRFVRHMGQADYDIKPAFSFYDDVCPQRDLIRECEKEAGEEPVRE